MVKKKIVLVDDIDCPFSMTPLSIYHRIASISLFALNSENRYRQLVSNALNKKNDKYIKKVKIKILKKKTK